MPGRVVKTNIRDLVQMMAERGILLAHNDDLAEGAAHVPDFEKRWHAYARPVGRIIEHKHGCKNWVRLSLLIGRDRSRWINSEMPPGLHFLAVHLRRQNYAVHLRNQFLSKCVSH
jgi:hypothetical protein